MKTILPLLVVAVFFFCGCTSEKGSDFIFQKTDWVGDWKIQNQTEQKLSTKASRGNIRLHPTKPDAILINGSLFNLNSSFEIEGDFSVKGQSVKFDSTDNTQKRIWGTGEMEESSKIIFLYSINDGSDHIRYKATAYKAN